MFEQQAETDGAGGYRLVRLARRLCRADLSSPSAMARPASGTAPLLPEQPNKNIVWLSEPGPGGGGGGGGNRMKEPPRQAEMPGKDKITVPVSKPPKMEMQEAKKEPDPVAQLNIRQGEEPRRWTRCRARSPRLQARPPCHRAAAAAAERHRHEAAASVRERSGPRPRQRRRHRRRRLSSRQRRLAAARAEGRASAVHLRRDAREGAGHRPARMCRPSRRFRGRRPDRSFARLDVRSRSGGHQGRQAVALPRRAPGSASRSPSRSPSSSPSRCAENSELKNSELENSEGEPTESKTGPAKESAQGKAMSTRIGRSARGTLLGTCRWRDRRLIGSGPHRGRIRLPFW